MCFSTSIALWIVARYCRVKCSCSFSCDVFCRFVCLFFSFLVVGLDLQRGCVYLLDVDSVRCFFNNSNTSEGSATKFEQEYVRCVRNEEESVCSPLQISLQYPH